MEPNEPNQPTEPEELKVKEVEKHEEGVPTKELGRVAEPAPERAAEPTNELGQEAIPQNLGIEGPVTRARKRRSRMWLAAILFVLLGAFVAITRSVLGFFTGVTILIQIFFLVYLIRHLSFAWAALAVRWRPSELVRDAIVYIPSVSVIVPARSEDRVLRRIVNRLMEMDYPKDKYQVIVVDDASTDQTPVMLNSLKKIYPHLVAIHRSREEWEKSPGKSSVLNHGLRAATGEVIVIYDADHLPEKDCVMRLVQHFADPKIGAVMGRCKIINRNENILTKLVSIDYLGGYLTNEYGRETLHNLPAYGGANCAIRKSLLIKFGGFNAKSVTEDTDITTRLILNGYKVVYDRNAIDWEEAVGYLNQFWGQRYRWAFGHQHVFYDHWLDILKSKHLGIVDKIESLMFLFVFHVPAIMFIGLALIILWGLGLFVPTDIFKSIVIWTLMFLGPFIEMGIGIVAEWAEGGTPPHPINLLLYPPLFLISIFICTKAFIDGLIYPLIGERYIWVKTRRRYR